LNCVTRFKDLHLFNF